MSGAAGCTIDSHSSDAGTYSDVITCGPGNLAADNYKFTTGSKAKLTINKANQAISFPAISTKPIGTTFDPGASASSQLAVVYTATPSSACAIDAGKVKVVGPGQCKVTASQGGNNNWNAAPTV